MLTRIKELDGLRGVAVILVMAGHIFRRANEFTHHPTLYFISSVASVGYVGVDIFFVLSGFLITSILINTRENQHYFKNFYMRRVLRIFPLYYAVMLIVFMLIIPIKSPEFVSKIPQLLPYQLLYLQNWVSFIPSIENSYYISITWSLAIEEQFYLFWPLLVYYIKKETLFKLGLGYFVLSNFIRFVGILFWQNINQANQFFYYNSFSRFDEMIFGGLLAIALLSVPWRERIKRYAKPILFISLALFSAAWWFERSSLNFRHIPLTLVSYTLVTAITAALIIIFTLHPENSKIRKIFGANVLIFFGKYSYAMYLFHLPILLILLDLLWKTRLRGWKMYVIYILSSFLVTIILSFLSWHLFEKRLLSLKKYFEYEKS